MKHYVMRITLLLMLAGLPFGALWVAASQLNQAGQDTGVFAEAIQQANVRARPDVDADLVDQIFAGTRYPVIGRSEFFPWVLLGNPDTFWPLGWVFNDLLTFTGDVNLVPLSSVDINTLPAAPPDPVADPAQQPGEPEQPAADIDPVPTQVEDPPTATPSFTVAGTSRGSINIRYGPSVDFPILGRAQLGDRFEIVAYHTQVPWVQVTFENSPTGTAWIALDLLDVDGNVNALPAVTTMQFNLPQLTPTPRVMPSVSVPGSEAVELSPEFQELGDMIWDYILASGFDPSTSRFGAVYLHDLNTGEALTFGSDVAFSGSSVTKISILMEYYARLDGQSTFSEAVDIANMMICSENVATNRMLGYTAGGDQLQGAENVTARLNQLGLQRTFLTAPFEIPTGFTPTPPPRAIRYPQTDADQTRATPDLTNQMTVEEMGWLMSGIYQCGVNESGPLIEATGGSITPQECRRMMHVMTNNTVDALLKAGVPEDIPVAHKHGWVTDTHSNAAIFFTPGGDYVLVATMHNPFWLVFDESLPVIANVSRMVFNHYNPDRALDEPREGFIPPTDQCNYTAEDQVVIDLASPTYLLNPADAEFLRWHQQPATIFEDTPADADAPAVEPTPTLPG